MTKYRVSRIADMQTMEVEHLTGSYEWTKVEAEAYLFTRQADAEVYKRFIGRHKNTNPPYIVKVIGTESGGAKHKHN